MSLSSIHFPCEGCGSGVDAAADAAKAACGACGKETPLSPGEDLKKGGPVEQCAVCGLEALYLQKDFNRRVGLWLVAGSAAASFVVYAYFGIWALVFLAVVTAFDALLYRLLPMVAVCYRCGAIYRGFPVNPRHGGFDLHIYETLSPKR